MASILRVRTTWSGYQGVPYLSTHYFTRTDGDSASFAADAVQALWEGCQEVISSSLSWNVEPEVAVLDSATGTLTGVDNIAGGEGGTGTASGEILPFATQGLIRWATGDVVSGRILRGHTFVPGATEAHSNLGVPTPGYQTVVNAAVSDMMTSPSQFLIIWSRTHGAIGPVLSGSTWGQWAVLRSRRD